MMKQTHTTLSQISGWLAMMLAPLALAQAPDTFLRVEASALLLTPQIAMDRAILFSDVLESRPEGTPRRFDGVSYLPMRLKEAGTVWVPEERAVEFRNLAVGEIHLLEGTVDQYSRRYHIMIHGCRTGLGAEETPADSPEPISATDSAGSGSDEDRDLLLQVLLEDARKSLEELARANNVTVAQLIESQPDGGQRIVENIVADSMQAQSPGANRTAQELMVGAVLTLLRTQPSLMMLDPAEDSAMAQATGDGAGASASEDEAAESAEAPLTVDVPIADAGDWVPDGAPAMDVAGPDALPEVPGEVVPQTVAETDAGVAEGPGTFWDAEPEYPPELATGEAESPTVELTANPEESFPAPAVDGEGPESPAGETAAAGSVPDGTDRADLEPTNEPMAESASGSDKGSLSSFVAFGMEDFLGISMDAPGDAAAAPDAEALAPAEMAEEQPSAVTAEPGAEVSGEMEPGIEAEATGIEPELAMAMPEAISEAAPAELAEPLPVPAEETVAELPAGAMASAAEDVPPADLAELVAEISGETEPGFEAVALEPEQAMAMPEAILEAAPAEPLPVPAEETVAELVTGAVASAAEDVPPADLAELVAEISGETEPGFEAAALEPELAMAMPEAIVEVAPVEPTEPMPVPAEEPVAELSPGAGASLTEEPPVVETVPEAIVSENPVSVDQPVDVDESARQQEAEEQARLLAAEQKKAEKAAQREELARQKEEKRRAVAEAKRLAAEEKKAAAAARKAEAARRKNEEAMAKAQAEALQAAQEKGSADLLATPLPEEVPLAAGTAGETLTTAETDALSPPLAEVPASTEDEAAIDAGGAATLIEEPPAAPTAGDSAPVLTMEEMVAKEAARLAEIARLKEEERQAKEEAERLAAEEKLAKKEAEALRKAEEKQAAEAARALRREAEKQAQLQAAAERKAAELAREEEARRQAEAARQAREAAAVKSSENLAAIEEQARLQREESGRRLAELEARKAAAEAVIQAEAQKRAESARLPEVAAVPPLAEPAGTDASQAEAIRVARETAENAQRIAREHAERIAQEESARVEAENRLRQMEAELREMEAQVKRQEEEKAQIERRRLQEEATAQAAARAAEEEARLNAERDRKTEAIRLAQEKATQARREAEETAARLAAEDTARKAAELRMQQLEKEVRALEAGAAPGQAEPETPVEAEPAAPVEPSELPEWMQPVWL